MLKMFSRNKLDEQRAAQRYVIAHSSNRNLTKSMSQAKEGEAEWKVMKDRNRILLGVFSEFVLDSTRTKHVRVDVWS